MTSSELGIGALLAGYRSGALVPSAVLRDAHDRAAAGDQPVWITLLPWAVVAAHVDRLDALDPRLPLYGIPFAIKDNIDLAATMTTVACPEFGYVPTRSAFVVDRLIAAGAIPLGKTNMDQFATGLVGTRTPYGACRSVVDDRYISGGSSSGSAVAVAAGMVSFALGTDTAGSGRVPAAFNDVVGLKPSLGLLSTRGVVPACRTLDCVSVFALDVADAARVHAAAVGYDPADAYSRRAAHPAPGRLHAAVGGAPPEIGVPAARQLEFFGDAGAAAAWSAALDDARRLGWRLVEIDFEPFAAAARLLYEGGWIAERAAAVGEFVAEHPDAVDPVVAEIIGRGSRPTAVEAFRSAYRLAELRRATEPDWARIDALLLPTAPTIYTPEEVAADPFGANAVLGTYTNFVNLMDLCALAVPGRRRDDGLPFGVTLVAPRDHDAELIELGRAWLGEPADAPSPRLAAPPAGPPSPTATPTPPQPDPPAQQQDTLVGVVGAHLSGLPLNHQLIELGATLAATTRTAPIYRLYALDAARPPKPGLVRAADGDGCSIELEVWRIGHAGLGRLIGRVAPPLAIGAVELIDGSTVAGFVCDSRVAKTSRDVSAWGGWRAFVAAEPTPALPQ